jgi:hypothetical protein
MRVASTDTSGWRAASLGIDLDGLCVGEMLEKLVERGWRVVATTINPWG